jgi:hypothetical protein
MKLMKLWLCAILAVIPLSGCTNSNQSLGPDVVSPEPTSSEKVVDLEAKDDIKKAVLGYIDFNCTPKYFTDVTDFGDGIVTRIKNMKVFNDAVVRINGNPDYMPVEYALSDDSFDSTYGNLVIRSTFLAIAYHQSLSGLYSYIYDIHSSELKSLQKDYTRFRLIADRAGKKLCPIAKKSSETVVLDETVVSEVQAIYDELASNWPGYKTWWAAANQLEENVSRNIEIGNQEAMTPKCTEYPTADGKYVVVKCTVPPG